MLETNWTDSPAAAGKDKLTPSRCRRKLAADKRMNSIPDFRRFYARYVVGNSTKPNERLIATFAAVEREHYAGPGPWKISTHFAGYLDTVSDDPRHLYQDVLIGLIPERHINNGQPSLHARCLAAGNSQSGETVVHIGAGTGYYTAILAELVGAGGKVMAYEIEPELADRARRNLSHLPNVQVIGVSGCAATLPPADFIYVNASTPQPLPVWLGALKPGGRLMFPLTPNKGVGCMLLVSRLGETKYAATAVSGAAFIPLVGGGDDTMSETLAAVLKKSSVALVKSLRRNSQPDASAWCGATAGGFPPANPLTKRFMTGISRGNVPA
jgi:protein-L-isoaspartate(D-aspartate) O-methyltransferase